MSCDNIIFNKINSNNKELVNGECICSTGFYDDRVHWYCQPCTLLDPQCSVCSYDPINSTLTNGSNLYQFDCSSCN